LILLYGPHAYKTHNFYNLTYLVRLHDVKQLLATWRNLKIGCQTVKNQQMTTATFLAYSKLNPGPLNKEFYE
jgi:hypothetical protein